jgi:hypothetical protein
VKGRHGDRCRAALGIYRARRPSATPGLTAITAATSAVLAVTARQQVLEGAPGAIADAEPRPPEAARPVITGTSITRYNSSGHSTGKLSASSCTGRMTERSTVLLTVRAGSAALAVHRGTCIAQHTFDRTVIAESPVRSRVLHVLDIAPFLAEPRLLLRLSRAGR